MGLPHITSFCWCMGLEMGAKCVGFLHLFSSLTFMVLCAVFAENLRGYVGTIEDVEDHVYTASYIVAVIIAIIATVHVILASILLYGVYNRSTAALRVWVYAMLVLFAGALVYNFIVVIAAGFSATGSAIFVNFLEGLLVYSVVAYCIICVYSFYLMLKSSEDMSGPNKDLY